LFGIVNGKNESSDKLGEYPKPSGYSFSPESVENDKDGHITAIVSYVPESKQYFKFIFNPDKMQDPDFKPHCEEFTIFIDRRKLVYCRQLFVYRDRDGEVMQVGHEGTTDWEPIKYARSGIWPLLRDVKEYYYSEVRKVEPIQERFIDCGNLTWDCARISHIGSGLMECYNEAKGHKILRVRNKDELVKSLCGK
jgi:hypothetical protein